MFFKTRITGDEMGELLNLVFKDPRVVELEERTVREVFGADVVKAEAIRHELSYLRAFGVDYATFATLGENATKAAVLEGFFSRIEREHDDSKAFIEESQQRFIRYTDALKRPHELGPFWTVGYAFAGEVKELDVVVATLGAETFKAMVNLTQRLLKAYRIKI